MCSPTFMSINPHLCSEGGTFDSGLIFQLKEKINIDINMHFFIYFS